MMRWVITGGCGFIGRALVADLLADGGHAVRVFDNLSVGSRADLAQVSAFSEAGPGVAGWDSRLALMVGDVVDPGAIRLAATGADVIVHLAANTGVGPSVEDPVFDCRSNVVGTLNTLEAARASGGPRVVFASSGAPLGVQVPPLHEEMAPHPASPYGASKLAGEAYCSAYFHAFGIDTIALRFGNVYGEGSSRKGSLVAKFIRQALAGETLVIHGDGRQSRDFIHVSDLVRAIRRAASVSGIGGECFQIATARETTVREITALLLDILEAEGVARPAIRFGPERAGDVARNFSDTRKARERLGWQACVGLEAGLRRTVQSFLREADLAGASECGS